MGAVEAITQLGRQARQASRALAQLNSAAKDAALEAMAAALLANEAAILAANAEDLAHADEFDLTAAMKKRLRLDAGKLAGMADGLRQVAALTDPVGSVVDTSRELATAMMRAEGYIDCIIPRGGAGLIKALQDNAKVPFILDGAGVCHTYVDAAADLAMAVKVAVNAKCQYPAVCNAMETLLVHQDVAAAFLPRVAAEYAAAGCELRGCPRTCALLPTANPADEEDWDTEYSDLILSVKVVDSLDAAMDHIAVHGTLHSECIITGDLTAAHRFCREVDAAAVYVNASTRFTDGERFGFGAEIGISTQKLHARGPLGLAELCSVKYIVEGDGQIV